jgi:hypothetical protein
VDYHAHCTGRAIRRHSNLNRPASHKPTCYGEVRKVILKHLGNRYGRIADRGEFVEYARSHDLKLDLTTPPVRYRAPQ